MQLNDDIKYVYSTLISCVFFDCANGKEGHSNYKYAEDDFLLLLGDIISGYPKDQLSLSLARSMFNNVWLNIINMQPQLYPSMEDMICHIKRKGSDEEVQFCKDNLYSFTKHITSLLDNKGMLYSIDPVMKLFK
jgi:hypothetical protein